MQHPQAVTAYHEAGHAVGAWRVGAHLTRVSIRPGVHPRKGPFGGIVEFQGPHGLGGREYVNRALLIAFAGPEAQRIYAPHSDVHGSSVWDYNDADNLIYILFGGSTPAGDALVRMHRLEARSLVKHEWRAIQVLAMALMLHETLDGNQTIEVLKSMNV